MKTVDEDKPLSGEERTQLLRAATAIAENAYAPYSNFRVGAAVLGDLATYTGVNVENASYGLGICAERSAISAAIAAGERKIRGIAIACVDASKDSAARLPCGACRQWIYELAPNAEILVGGNDAPFCIEELLPRPFKCGKK
jgi:cytidine deaminase